MLSVQTQSRELTVRFGNDPEIEIVGDFAEAMSAKAPGRPVFNDMIRRIQTGDAEGIIAWHPDRLARNSIDGGQLIYLLDQGCIKDLRFATYTFENNPMGKFMLQVMFGQSKYYVDHLSENVRSGCLTKVKNGWLPNRPPLGYLNDKETETIIEDPERYLNVSELLRLAIDRGYSVQRLWQIAVYDMGLTTRKSKRIGGKLVSPSSIYKILKNPFYAGVIRWNGQLYPGKHNPMITLDEYDRLQLRLRGGGTTRPKRYIFAYTGIIHCGACGLSVTAEHKTNRFGSHYVYYHCTRRREPKCRQPSVEVCSLEDQIRDFLDGLELSERSNRFILDEVNRVQADRKARRQARERSLQSAIDTIQTKKKALTDMRMDKLIDDDEFISRRQEFCRDELKLRQSLAKVGIAENRFEPYDDVLWYRNRAISWLSTDDEDAKRLILRSAGSNPTLKDKILNVSAIKPFRSIGRNPSFSDLLAFINDIRTCEDDPDFIASLKCIRHLRKKSEGEDHQSAP